MTEPIPWNGVFERVKSEIPAAPDVLIRHQINATVIDFTSDTNIFVEEVPINIQPNVTRYPFVLVNGGRPNRLLLVYDPKASGAAGPYHWADSGITMRIPNIIQLTNVPTAAKAWTAVIAKSASTPALTTDVPPKPTGYLEIDPWIVDKYYDVIYYGAMFLLQRMPAKPFRDDKSAMLNAALYTAGRSHAKVDNQWGNVYNAQAWMFPQSFRTISRKGWA
jgi:hypothetical protein